MCLFIDNWRNDIALVKLAQDLPLVPLDDTVDTVKLPETASWPSAGTNCSIHGWGCTSSGKHFNVTTFKPGFHYPS